MTIEDTIRQIVKEEIAIRTAELLIEIKKINGGETNQAPSAQTVQKFTPAPPPPPAQPVAPPPAQPVKSLPVTPPPAPEKCPELIKSVTLEVLQQIGRKFMAANRVDLIRPLLDRFGVKKLSELNPEQYLDFYNEASAIQI